MLIRIRDEIDMTIGCYQELFESIIAHGIRKVLLVSIVFRVDDVPITIGVVIDDSPFKPMIGHIEIIISIYRTCVAHNKYVYL